MKKFYEEPEIQIRNYALPTRDVVIRQKHHHGKPCRGAAAPWALYHREGPVSGVLLCGKEGRPVTAPGILPEVLDGAAGKF